MQTPLYIGVRLSNLEIVQELLAAGADPDGRFSSLPGVTHCVLMLCQV
jgi:hypothetical protein